MSVYNKDSSNVKPLQGKGVKYFPNHLQLPENFRNRRKVVASVASSSTAPQNELNEDDEEEEDSDYVSPGGDEDSSSEEEEEEEEGDEYMEDINEEEVDGLPKEREDDSEDDIFAPALRVDQPPPVEVAEGNVDLKKCLADMYQTLVSKGVEFGLSGAKLSSKSIRQQFMEVYEGDLCDLAGAKAFASYKYQSKAQRLQIDLMKSNDDPMGVCGPGGDMDAVREKLSNIRVDLAKIPARTAEEVEKRLRVGKTKDKPRREYLAVRIPVSGKSGRPLHNHEVIIRSDERG
jgi:hypothetical protein